MTVYRVGEKFETATQCESRETAAAVMAEGACIWRKHRGHWYIQCDRTWQGGGFTSVRAGYGGLIEEPIADAIARFLRLDPCFTPDA